MALFASHFLTAASGSVGGLNFLRTTGGMAIRAKAHPVDPNTPSQGVIRRFLAFLTATWSDRMTPDDRSGWRNYARNTELTGPLGTRRNVGGLPMFVRCSLPRLYAGVTFRLQAPTIFGKAAFTPIVPLVASASLQAISYAFDTTEPWANERGGAMLIFIARPVGPGRRSPPTAYRLAETLEGSPFIPPASPGTSPAPFPIAIGQRLFLRVTVTRNDARYSSEQVSDLLVT